MDIEHEQGTFTGRTSHHRGYYAGDFSDRPFPTRQQLELVLRLSTVAAPRPRPWAPA